MRTNRPNHMLKINNVSILSPSSFKEAPYDIWQYDTGRDIDVGDMHGQIINKKRKWNASWNGLSEAERISLTNAIMSARGNNSFFTLTVSSVEPGGISGTVSPGSTETYTVYLGDRTYEFVQMIAGREAWTLTLSFIER